MMLQQISVSCFASSYAVVLAIELSRIFSSRDRWAGWWMAGWLMTLAGLFAHASYLLMQGRGGGSSLWASWSEWSMLTAMILAICYAVVSYRRRETIVGWFFLPAILALIGLGIATRDVPPFDRTRATEIWRTVHAAAMTVGTAAVVVGFVAALMYLVQARRLKRHRAGSGLRLPTLETLTRTHRQTLAVSTTSVAVGVAAGVVMNVNRWGSVRWLSGGVLLSTVLLVWLLAAAALEWFYKPASRGRKAVYVTVASLGFLILAVGGVMSTDHGQVPRPPSNLATPAAAVKTGAAAQTGAAENSSTVIGEPPR